MNANREIPDDIRKRLFADPQVKAARATKKRSEVVKALTHKLEQTEDEGERTAIEALIAEVRGGAKQSGKGQAQAQSAKPQQPAPAEDASDIPEPEEGSASSKGGGANVGGIAGAAGGILVVVVIMILRAFGGGGTSPQDLVHGFYVVNSWPADMTLHVGNASVDVPVRGHAVVPNVGRGEVTVRLEANATGETVVEETVEVSSSGLHVYNVFGLTKLRKHSEAYVSEGSNARPGRQRREELEHTTFYHFPEVNIAFEQPPEEIDVPSTADVVSLRVLTASWDERMTYAIQRRFEAHHREPEETLQQARQAVRAMLLTQAEPEAAGTALNTLLTFWSAPSGWEPWVEELEWIDQNVDDPHTIAYPLAQVAPFASRLREAVQAVPELRDSLNPVTWRQSGRLANAISVLMQKDEQAWRAWVKIPYERRGAGLPLNQSLAADAEQLANLMRVTPETMAAIFDLQRPHTVLDAARRGLEHDLIEQFTEWDDQHLQFLNHVATFEKHLEESEGPQHPDEPDLYETVVTWYATLDGDARSNMRSVNPVFAYNVLRNEPSGTLERLAVWPGDALFMLGNFEEEWQRYIFDLSDAGVRFLAHVMQERNANWLTSFFNLAEPARDALIAAFSEVDPDEYEFTSRWELRPLTEHSILAQSLGEIGGPFARVMLVERNRTLDNHRHWLNRLGEDDREWLATLSYEQTHQLLACGDQIRDLINLGSPKRDTFLSLNEGSQRLSSEQRRLLRLSRFELQEELRELANAVATD